MPERTALYPGSFDPPTFGHLDLIERAVKIFHHVIVAVATNNEKSCLFTVAEREEMLREMTREMPQVEVTSFTLRNELGASFPAESGLGIKPMSEKGSKRLIRKAIQYAIAHGRQSVTLVHKGNIQKYTEGAFRTWGYELARQEFGDVTLTEQELWDDCAGIQPAGRVVIKDRIADIMFQHLLINPDEFDVLATPNLNGDYLSDAAAAQVGGVGIAPGVNMGDRVALFEATHGTAPTIAGQNRANPGSLLLSGVLMLEHIGWQEAADAIMRAFEKTIKDGRLTEDLASQRRGITVLGTAEFASAVIENL